MQEESPELSTDLSPEDAKASLGLATRLSEQHLMSQVPQEGAEAPVDGQEPQGGAQMGGMPQPEAPDPEALKKDIMGQVESLIDEKMGELKDMLTEALSDDEPEKETKDKESAD